MSNEIRLIKDKLIEKTDFDLVDQVAKFLHISISHDVKPTPSASE